ncbi:ScbA/BarX family gamma-butyrolactone biosynthesis protein [Streptomyces sp. NPDC020807]|uniref:ScbA/BarX family gamma-butyrolactone biosynthesis protein n=1 Tax=Streptomyces sp. NPDC020807 TaxID=3155119 RepID=UPI0033E8CD2E
MSLEPSDATVSFPRTPLPPAEVHKAAADQVLLAGAARLGEDRFEVAALWPGDHPLYHADPRGFGDPTLVAESARQTALHLGHRFHGVERSGERLMILNRITVDVTPPGLPHASEEALSVTMDVTSSRTDSRPSRDGDLPRTAMVLDAEFRIDGVRHARASVHWTALPARRYAVLRRRNGSTGEVGSPPPGLPPARPLAPEEVGRRHARDVLLATADGLPENRWLLTMDRTHPVYFDHESDHIQGMVLLEALLQAARTVRLRSPETASHRDVYVSAPRFTVDYAHFGELDQPVTVTAERGTAPEEGLVLTAVQGGRELVRCALADDETPEAAPR